MLSFFDRLAYRYLDSSDRRSRNIFKNILYSGFIRLCSVLVNLLIVPLSIQFVDVASYGVWITVSSVLAWITFFDIGLGNGLRNKLADSLARNNDVVSKEYVSTAYAAFALFSLLLVLLVFLVNPLVPWRSFLNIPETVSVNIQVVFLIALVMFCVQFVLQLINSILNAFQKPSLVSLIVFGGQLLTLVVLFIYSSYRPGDLIRLTWINMLSVVAVLFAANIILFATILKGVRPSVKYIKLRSFREVLRVGISFFFIQVGSLIVFQTANIIIAKYIGPVAVAEFNIAFRLFSLVIFGFTIILTPYWSAFTDAYARRDFEWIRKNVRRTRVLWVLFSAILVPILLLFSSRLYELWIGGAVHISFSTSLAVAVYAVVYMGMVVSTYFINGVGRINLQKYLYIAVCIINIPMSIWMAGLYGVPGVVLSSAALMAVMLVVLWLQTDGILNEINSVGLKPAV